MFKYEWIWEKDQGTGHLNAKKIPLKSHENIAIFYKKLPTYNPQFWYKKDAHKVKRVRPKMKAETVYGKNGTLDGYVAEYDNRRYPLSTSLKFTGVKKTIHPTQKPVALFEYLIKTYTNEGETVLDNCIGSGTTAIAAINTKRNFIGFELDETYFNLANERIEIHTKEE